MMSDITDKREEKEALTSDDEDDDDGDIFVRLEFSDEEIVDDNYIALLEALNDTSDFEGSSDDDDDRSLVEKLIDSLREIQGKEISYFPRKTSVVYKIPYILSFIFYIGEDCLKFTDEQKEEIATLLVQAFEPIQLYSVEAAHFYTARHPCVLQYRSALEYLKIYYADFPAKDKISFKESLTDSVIKSIKYLEDVNIRLPRRLNEDWSKHFDAFGGSSVPDTHYWWRMLL